MASICHWSFSRKNADDYNEDFVNEVLQLELKGFLYRGKVLKIKVFGFSCDAPANGVTKYSKIHTEYESSKCEIYGNWMGASCCWNHRLH